jgi:hypothetical protein
MSLTRNDSRRLRGKPKTTAITSGVVGKPVDSLPTPLASGVVVNGFYRTIRDMTNPYPQKNSKRIACLSVIRAGTQCKVLRHPEGRGNVTFRDGSILYFLNYGEQGEAGYIPGEAFLNNLETIPDNVHTILQAGCGMPAEHVLAYLVEEGKISLTSITNAVRTITEMGDKEINWLLAKHWLK